MHKYCISFVIWDGTLWFWSVIKTIMTVFHDVQIQHAYIKMHMCKHNRCGYSVAPKLRLSPWSVLYLARVYSDHVSSSSLYTSYLIYIYIYIYIYPLVPHIWYLILYPLGMSTIASKLWLTQFSRQREHLSYITVFIVTVCTMPGLGLISTRCVSSAQCRHLVCFHCSVWCLFFSCSLFLCVHM